jgi:hypothetical protein
MCRSSSFPLQASATSDLRFARNPVRREWVPPTGTSRRVENPMQLAASTRSLAACETLGCLV